MVWVLPNDSLQEALICGRQHAAVTRTLLTDSAHAYLHQVVESYRHLQQRDSKTVEAALKLEAQQWRNRLEPAEPEPNSPATVFQFLKDFRPDLTARQYTFLASGTGFTYPPEETFPGRSDPRQFPWYEAAREKMALTRTLDVPRLCRMCCRWFGDSGT